MDNLEDRWEVATGRVIAKGMAIASKARGFTARGHGVGHAEIQDGVAQVADRRTDLGTGSDTILAK